MAQSSSEECHGLECDVCLEHGLNKVATAYCEICDELLCQTCESAHRGMKLLRNHGLIAASKLTKSFRRSKTLPIAFCDEHSTDKGEFICEDHSVVCCNPCKLSTHRTCQILTLQEKTKHAMDKKQFEIAIHTLMSLKTKVEKLSTTRKEHAETVKMLGQKFVEELKKLKEKIFVYICELEEKLAREIDKAVKHTTTEIQSHLATVDVVIQGLNSSLDVLRSCSETKDDKLMAIGLVKMTRKIKDYENTVASVEDEIKTPNIQLHMMDLERLKTQINSLGSVANGQDDNFLDLKVSNSFDMSMKSSWISGSVFMQNGEVIMCDRANKTIVLYTRELKQKSSLKCPSSPWDVEVLDKTEIIVTLPNEKKLVIYTVKEDIQLKNEINVKEQCWGVSVKKTNIYVSTHIRDNNGEVLVLDKSGQLLRKIGHRTLSQHSIQAPFYVCVGNKEDRIYLSCYWSHTVTCIDQAGGLIFQYKGDITGPFGMYLDDQDNVLVCGRVSNNACLLKNDGTLHKTLLTHADGIIEPHCLAFRPSDKTLVVGMFSKPFI